MKMINKDCEKCEMLDTKNPEFPCKLEEHGSVIRCNILNEYMKTLKFKSEDL